MHRGRPELADAEGATVFVFALAETSEGPPIEPAER